MAREFSRARIGLFVLLGIGSLLGIIIWLGSQHVFTEYDRYVTYFTDSVSGLDISAPVKFRGVAVGRVADIKIDPKDSSQIEVVLDLRPGTPVKKDMEAELRMTGITGIKYVELAGGAKETELLAPSKGLKITVIPSRRGLLDKVDQQFQDLYEQLNGVITNLRELTQKESQERFIKFLDGISTLSVSLAATLDSLKPGLQRVDSLTRESENLIVATREQIQGVGEATRAGIKDATSVITDKTVRDALSNFNKTSAEMLTFAEKLNKQMTSVNPEDLAGELRTTLNDLQLVAGNLNQLLSELKQDPALLLFSKPEQEHEHIGQREKR